MNSIISSICDPWLELWFYINSLKSIECRKIEFPCRVIVFQRISCCYYHPALRESMTTKYFHLKKLQHCGRKCFRYAVNLIQKENSFPLTSFFHLVIHASNDFTHCVFRSPIAFITILMFRNKRQSYCTLPSVMRHRI